MRAVYSHLQQAVKPLCLADEMEVVIYAEVRVEMLNFI